MISPIFGLLAPTRNALYAGTAAFALIMPGVAFAQEEVAEPADASTAVEEEGEGNEIIVTATKREQTLQEIPVAVSVTTAETIERAQIRDLKDLTSVVPSLRISQLQSSANTNFIIRGFGNGANNPGIEPSVGVFVDGVYRSRTAAQIGDLPDVQRIEVLRGPQSTLFGKNASAGVISLITKKPQFKFGGNVEAAYGNYNAVVVKGVVTGPITDTIAASIAGGINKRDGYIRDTGYDGRTNERDRWFVRGQLLLEPTDALSIRLIGDYDKIDENCCGVVQLANGNPIVNALTGRTAAVAPFADRIATNFPSSNDIKNYGGSGQLDYSFGPIKLTSITAYRKSESLTNADSDFSTGDFLGANIGDVDIGTFTQELRLATDLDGPFLLLLGGFYFDETVKYKNDLTFGRDFRTFVDLATGGRPGVLSGVGQLETLVLGLPLNTFSRAGQGIFDQYRQDDKSFSLFGSVDFEVTDRLTLTLGANYTDDKKKVRSNTISTDAFSALDLVAIGGGVIRSRGIATTVGQFLGLPAGTLATAAQIGAFSQAQPAGFAQIVAGSTAFANANQNNPAVNPFLALRPLQFLPPFLNFPNAVEDGKSHDTDWSYTARLAYEVNDAINVYGSYSTGFKPTTFNLSRDSRPLAADIAAIRAVPGLAPNNLSTGSRSAPPENSTVYEFGLKANWGLVSVNFAAFHQTITDFQSNVFTGTGFLLASAGKQSVKGFEFDGTVRPIDPLTLTLALTYLDPKFDTFRQSALGDLSGTRPAGVPAISTTFGASYDHEFGGGDHLILRGDFHYESAVQIAEGLPGFLAGGNAAARAAARPFRREVNDLNASITYAMQNGLELSLWGRNLLDDRYIIQIFDVPAQTGNIAGYPNQPRTYGVAARFRF